MDLGILTEYLPPAVLLAVVAVTKIIVQLLKVAMPAIQGRVTLILVCVVAFVLSALIQGALWQAGQEFVPWSFHGVLQIVLETVFGAAGAIGVDAAINTVRETK
jgi:hypothetical protein